MLVVGTVLISLAFSGGRGAGNTRIRHRTGMGMAAALVPQLQTADTGAQDGDGGEVTYIG